MDEFRDIQHFVHAAGQTTSVRIVQALVEDLGRALGFDYVGLTHHVDFLELPPGAVSFGNYPAHWLELLVERRYYSDDPVHVACQKAIVGFRWEAIPSLIRLSPRHLEILENARREGVHDGFTVPIHIPGELHGSCSFAVRGGRSFPTRSVPAAQAAGCYAFEAARRVARLAACRVDAPAARPRLTQRQLDCLVLVGRGKSDTDAAHLLGISPHTVHQHIEAAKQELDVASRQQLVARALFDGLVTFSDLLNPAPSPD